MIPIRGGIRRLLLLVLAFVAFLIFCYETFHSSNPQTKLLTRGSSLLSAKSFQMKIPLDRGHQSNSINESSFTELGLDVVKKLEKIYKHIDVSKTNISRNIFPAYQIGEYLMLNPNICTDATIIDVIIIVHTAPWNFDRRRVIRTTFANRELFIPKQIRIAFLLGKPKDPSLEEKLEIEHKIYNDTVMGDFYDDYHNLTLKGVMGYHWVGEYCPNAKVVLKIDDDVVIDMYNFFSRYMPHIEGKQKSIFCNTWRKNMDIARKGKWKVPSRYFRNLRFFPYFYCSGFTVLFTTDLMKPLYEAAKVTPFFWIDDLFLYGILPKVVGDITYYDYKNDQNISIYTRDTIECMNKYGADCSIFSTLAHGDDFLQTWAAIQSLRNKTVKWYVESVYEP